jgi:hypothetical protein
MAAAMTSWKEVASYLGKGVRTAQRWESEFGLPVRRQNATSTRGAIVVFPAELDAWLQARFSLRKDEDELSRLRRENAELRQQLQRYETEKISVLEIDSLSLIARSSEIRSRTASLHQELKETMARHRILLNSARAIREQPAFVN